MKFSVPVKPSTSSQVGMSFSLFPMLETDTMDRSRGSPTPWEGIFVALLIGIFVGIELNCSLSFGSNAKKNVAYNSEDSIVVSSPDQYSLAYEQSNGFFLRSISNHEWKLRQAAARNATFHRYVGHPRRHWEKPNLWYYNNYDPIFSCPFAKRVRGIGDGPKWTCDPHQLKRLAYSRKEANQPPCLLYSIGSNGNYQWEDGMYEETDGLCEIHVFDYSQNYTRRKNKDMNIYFHQWGLRGSGQLDRGGIWKTMPQIIRELGHESRTIDVLKIDCEGCEWDSFQDWIDLDIRQILIETHSLPQNKSLGLKFFDAFIQNHFAMFSKEVNPWGGGQHVEFSYIKLHPDFLGHTVQNIQ